VPVGVLAVVGLGTMGDKIEDKVNPYVDVETATGIHACAGCPGDKAPVHAHSVVLCPKQCAPCICYVCDEHTNTDELLVTCIGTQACAELHAGVIKSVAEREASYACDAGPGRRFHSFCCGRPVRTAEGKYLLQTKAQDGSIVPVDQTHRLCAECLEKWKVNSMGANSRAISVGQTAPIGEDDTYDTEKPVPQEEYERPDDWQLVYDDDDEQREKELAARRANNSKIKKGATCKNWWTFMRDMCNGEHRFAKFHPSNGTNWNNT